MSLALVCWDEWDESLSSPLSSPSSPLPASSLSSAASAAAYFSVCDLRNRRQGPAARWRRGETDAVAAVGK